MAWFYQHISQSCYLLQSFILSFSLPLSSPFFLFPYYSFFLFTPLPFYISIMFLKRLEDWLHFSLQKRNYFSFMSKCSLFSSFAWSDFTLCKTLRVLQCCGSWQSLAKYAGNSLHIGWCSVSVPCLAKWLQLLMLYATSSGTAKEHLL